MTRIVSVIVLNNPFFFQDNRRCVSVNDIRRAFEKAEQSLSESVKGGAGAVGLGGLFGLSPSHHRMSSLDSTTSDESSIPTPHNCYGSVSSLISGQTNLKDHYGSITSLASSTSLISPQVNSFFYGLIEYILLYKFI
jgi:hypothetical protein